MSNILQDLLYWLPALIVAMSIHEYAHAKAADMLGDPTPGYAGRLTLNPLRHVDPVGLLMLVFVRFGWAKPVPVNPLYFKGDRRRGMLLVALAGPVANFLLATLTGAAFGLSLVISTLWFPVVFYINIFLSYLILYNVYLGVFNLLPIPPLDGSKILFSLLPPRYTQFMWWLEQYGFLILVFILITGLHRFFLLPVAEGITSGIYSLAKAVVKLGLSLFGGN